MENRKWLKRKYPKTFKKVDTFLNDGMLIEFKKFNYKLGVLTNDIIQCQTYKKGRLIMFKRTNPVNDQNYPVHHGVIKCQKGYTASGYHSIPVLNQDFKEIVK